MRYSGAGDDGFTGGFVDSHPAAATEVLPLGGTRRRVAHARPPALATWPWALAASVATLALLLPIQGFVARPMLLAERFVPGGGWVQALLLSLYAAFLLHRMMDPKRSGTWRRGTWLMFSVVFFGQLALGLAGFDSFLMTGTLHVPVPAVIVGGPAFRGEGFFMPILFGSTLLLVGPAWCSHLCYIGAWDALAASRRKRPAALPAWRRWSQPGVLVATVAVGVVLRAAGAEPGTAAAVALAFGIAGIGVMAFASRRLGAMVHCTAYCPIGWLATRLGRVSPFRLRIATDCTECGVCAAVCRYGALEHADIARRRPGPGCTLCGDCVKACRDGFAEYRFAGLRSDRARALFLVVVVALHAAFLGVARI